MKRPAVLAIAALGALLAGLLIYGVSHQGAPRTLDKAIADGKLPPAPDHTLPMLVGAGDRSLASYRGKVVFLNFFASWCAPCVDEAGTLRAFQNTLNADGTDATIIGVAYKDRATKAAAFLKSHGLDYPSLNDNKLQLASLYGTVALPETFVIDAKGRLVAISRGEVSKAFLDNSLKRALRS